MQKIVKGLAVLLMVPAPALAGAGQSLPAEGGTARGIITALTEATVAVDFSARVLALPVLEGAAFRKGDLLIQFDCRRFAAELTAARAQAHAKELVMATNRRLLSRGAIGGSEVKVSEAQFEEARANAEALRSRMANCQYRAPFDGRLVERIVQAQESPAPNQPLIKIVDMTHLEIEAIIPSSWLNLVRPGDGFSFAVEENGSTLSAEVARMGATIDPVSQTIKVYGVITNSQDSVLPGMSGTATFRPTGS